MRRISFLIAIALSWLLLPPIVARADQPTPLSIEQLTSESQLILQGIVRTKSVQRDAAGRIYTKVELEVSEVWKGTLATNRFTIVHGGGILGEIQTVVSGQAEYEVGEEVVAFLVINPEGQGVSIGLAQGKFHVWQEGANGEKLVRNPFHGGEAAAPPASGNAAQSAPAPSGRLTLTDLKRRAKGGGQ
jgi:hypothetical protein